MRYSSAKLLPSKSMKLVWGLGTVFGLVVPLHRSRMFWWFRPTWASHGDLPVPSVNEAGVTVSGSSFSWCAARTQPTSLPRLGELLPSRPDASPVQHSRFSALPTPAPTWPRPRADRATVGGRQWDPLEDDEVSRHAKMDLFGICFSMATSSLYNIRVPQAYDSEFCDLYTELYYLYESQPS